MKRIKFRARAINRPPKGTYRTNYKNGDWVYGLVTRLFDDRWENLPAEMKNLQGIDQIEVDHKTISQFTGLKDKNGVEIYDGDILNMAHSVWEVKYIDHGYKAVSKGAITSLRGSCEIIGNIHENPELLLK